MASKVVSHHSDLLAPIAVDSILRIIGEDNLDSVINCDLNNIHVAKKIGGTIDDSELINGLVFVDKKASHFAGGPTRIENAKIGMIQFPLSAPKTDLESNVVVHDYTAMDRLLKEEKRYILDLVKKIIATGCNVILLQKSILREAISDLALHFLAKKKIMVIKDIDRDQIDFIARTISATPVAHIDQFSKEKLGRAGLVCEESAGASEKIVKVLDCPNEG
jgi:T-complex protein 1 subunit delta